MSASDSQVELVQPIGIELARHAVMRIDYGRACDIRVAHGAAWITQDGDTEDVVLEEGDSFRLSGKRGALLSACGREPLTFLSVAPVLAD